MSIDLSASNTYMTPRPIDQRMAIECDQRGLEHTHQSSWPHEPGVVATSGAADLVMSEFAPGSQAALWQRDEAVALVTTGDGTLTVVGAGKSPESAAEIVEWIKSLFPPRADSDAAVVAVTFWSASQHGGRAIRRDIDVADWGDIEENYPRCEELSVLMSEDFRPGSGGQLLLWHGEPGTGKTTALRALANEWRAWCDLHYIVDPEAFFGSRADYMMEVMTRSDEYVDGPPVREGLRDDVRPRWRLLVLEDCGEMLQPDARKEVGQALSRLLNACDGLIGRGLRILVLVTTNEPIEKLHDAVSRPGRCAARVKFERFTPTEAEAWMRRRDADYADRKAPTLADLYGRLEGFPAVKLEHPVGFAS